MIRSGKVFVRTKTAFWKDKKPENTLTCTITDDLVRGTYLFDFDDTDSGVICLSYTWEDSAAKFHALSEEAQVKKSLAILWWFQEIIFKLALPLPQTAIIFLAIIIAGDGPHGNDPGNITIIT